jgi:hypothetical protein
MCEVSGIPRESASLGTSGTIGTSGTLEPARFTRTGSYLALAVLPDGSRDVLGIWIAADRRRDPIYSAVRADAALLGLDDFERGPRAYGSRPSWPPGVGRGRRSFGSLRSRQRSDE